MKKDKPTDLADICQEIDEIQDRNIVPLDTIRTEVNFSALPFFALSNRDASSRPKLEYHTTIERDGQSAEALWRVVATMEYGYPTPFDRKVHKAVEHIITEKGLPVENPILFSVYEILKMLGLSSRGGANYRKVRETIRRIVHTGIDSEGAFYSKDMEQHISDSFHLYDRAIFKGTKMPDGEIAETNYLFLSHWYLSSINALYVRPIDFHYLRSLNSHIASRLYELVSLRFYGVLMNKRSYWRVEYAQLCDLLPITRQRYISKAKEKLEPAHRELITTSFLDNAEWEETDRGDWHIRYYPGNRAVNEFRQARSRRRGAEQLDLPLGSVALPRADKADTRGMDAAECHDGRSQAVQLLVERGITQSTAESLADMHLDRIEPKIEVFDWLIETSSPLVQTNPSGFLRKSIEEDWQPPPGFISKAERERKAKQAEEQKQQREAKEKEAFEQERRKFAQRRAKSPWKDLWEQMARELRGTLSPEVFSSWIEPILIADVKEDVVVLSVPNSFFVRWIRKHYLGSIEGALSTIRGQPTQLQFLCEDVTG